MADPKGITKPGPAETSGATSFDFAANLKKLTELKPDARNANKGSARGNALISESLRKYGAGRSILLDRNGAIIAGNKTAENAGALGMDEVIVVRTNGEQLVAVQRMDLDLDSPAARELAIADNRASEVSLSWDTDVLKGLAGDGVDLAPFWTPDELAEFWPVQLQGDEDDVPPAPATPVTKLGDLWLLGEHRLLCGDSTRREEVDRLMAGSRAACMRTDPPYGVSYVGKTKDAKTIQNDGSEGLRGLLDAAFSNAGRVLAPGSPVYVSHPAGSLNVTFGNAFLAAGWRLHQTLIWDKGTMVLGHSDYHFAHEPIFYGYTPGDGRFGRGAKNWHGTDSERSILQFAKPVRSETHPTMKPVGLIERCLINSSEIQGLVLDLFGGSGSTLIACEKLRRRCLMMELSPAYCDVIVTRWEQATGKKATLDGAASKRD